MRWKKSFSKVSLNRSASPSLEILYMAVTTSCERWPVKAFRRFCPSCSGISPGFATRGADAPAVLHMKSISDLNSAVSWSTSVKLRSLEIHLIHSLYTSLYQVISYIWIYLIICTPYVAIQPAWPIRFTSVWSNFRHRRNLFKRNTHAAHTIVQGVFLLSLVLCGKSRSDTHTGLESNWNDSLTWWLFSQNAVVTYIFANNSNLNLQSLNPSQVCSQHISWNGQNYHLSQVQQLLKLLG